MNLYQELIEWHRHSYFPLPLLDGKCIFSFTENFFIYYLRREIFIRVHHKQEIVIFVCNSQEITLGPGRTLVSCNFDRAQLSHFKKQFVDIIKQISEKKEK